MSTNNIGFYDEDLSNMHLISSSEEFQAYQSTFEPPCEQTGLRGFRPGPTQTGLYSHRRWLEAWTFGFR